MQIKSIVKFVIQAVHEKRLGAFYMGQTNYFGPGDLGIVSESDIKQALNGLLDVNFHTEVTSAYGSQVSFAMTEVNVVFKGEIISTVKVITRPTIARDGRFVHSVEE